MEHLLQNLSYAVRMYRTKPGLTFVLLLTLTVGIGATTAIFSVLNVVWFHPLPFHEDDRLVRLYDLRHRDNGETSRVSLSARNFYQVREQTRSFESSTAQLALNLNLLQGETPERIVGVGVSDRWLSTLGVGPVKGRSFTRDEENGSSQSRVVLVSYGFWQRRFGSDPAMLGQSITLDDQKYTIIGVLPPGFDYPYHAELWIPWNLDRNNGRTHALNVQARLKPGISAAQAQAELNTIAGRLAREFPETNSGYTLMALPLRDVMIEGRDQMILILLGAAGFLLLIACANTANLLLVRSIGRRKEFAIRSALGASHLHTIRQLLTENVFLSVIAGAGGVLFTLWVRGFLIALVPPELTYVVKEVPVDLRVLGFTLLLSNVLGVIIGLAPALRASRIDLQTALKESGRGGGQRRGRMLSCLVVGELAVAVVLLTGTARLIQTIYALKAAPLGFATQNLLTLRIALTDPRYTAPQQRSMFVEQVLEQLRAVPGVDSAVAANLVPLTSGNVTAALVEAGRAVNPNEQLVVNHRVISPGYFESLRVPLLRGRAFTQQDQANSQPVVVISQRMARRYWPVDNPIGKQVRAVRGGAPSPWLTIVGVVGDVEETTPSRKDVFESWYIPFAQDLSTDRSAAGLQVAIRAAAPAGMSQALKEAIWRVNRNVPVFGIATAEQLYSDSLAQIRLTTIVTVCFSTFGLLMAILGTYGVFSYKVGQRTQEIGIRMSLGASPADILRLIGKAAAGHVLLGTMLGLGGAVASMRLIASVLGGGASGGPVMLVGVASLLSVIAIVACYGAIRRATRVNPIVALRHE